MHNLQTTNCLMNVLIIIFLIYKIMSRLSLIKSPLNIKNDVNLKSLYVIGRKVKVDLDTSRRLTPQLGSEIGVGYLSALKRDYRLN